jgi:hypothetical protein
MILQTDPSWLLARIGKLTASRMADAMAMVKDGPKGKDGTQKMKAGAARATLLRELLAERLVGHAKDHYVTPAMQWGLDYEAEAVQAYEAHTANLCAPGGFVDHPQIDNFGATPDRLIGRDGMLEVKCPTTATYVQWRLDGVVPEEHRPQMAAQILCLGRKWVDFVAYDPRLPPEYRLFVRRFEPTDQYLIEVEQAAIAFLNDLDLMFDQFTFMGVDRGPTVKTAAPDTAAAAA